MNKSLKLTLATCNKISVEKTDKPNVYKIIYSDSFLRNSTLLNISEGRLMEEYNVIYSYRTLWSNSGRVLFLDVYQKGIIEKELTVLPDTLDDFLKTIQDVNNLLVYSDTYMEIKDETDTDDSKSC